MKLLAMVSTRGAFAVNEKRSTCPSPNFLPVARVEKSRNTSSVITKILGCEMLECIRLNKTLTMTIQKSSMVQKFVK